MDDFDRAAEAEERDRAIAISAARRPLRQPLAEKRKRVAMARELAGQHTGELVDLVCENCGDPLPVESEDVDSIFCCPECSEDWEKREKLNQISGK